MVKLNLEYKKPVKLTFKTGNPKTDKNLKQEYNKYWILRLNLAPYTISGYNVCPSASVGCAESCLHTANIFLKCSTLCISPASCHLKTSSLICVAIASTHNG